METVSLLRRCAAVLLLAAAAQPALACKGDTGGDGSYDEHTICPEHYPADAPRFEDYPAQPYAGPVAAVRWAGDAQARMFRTRLKEAARQRPNFAGHFIVAHWGCGAGCVMSDIIDARTGKVLHPADIATNDSRNVHDSFWDKGGLLRYRADSRLFVLVGAPGEDEARRGISFYEWTGTRMKLLRHVHVPSGF
jgi:hypothetical protein